MSLYNFRYNGIILIGDTHSTTITRDILGRPVMNNTDVIHLGDVGLGFGRFEFAMDNAKSWLDMFNKICQKESINLYLTRGNHDNPDVWKLPNYSNVFFLQDGDTGIFPNGKKALLVGGGVSVDRYTRKEGLDYWRDETTKDIDIVDVCDIMFSHDCPEHFNHSTHTLPRHYGWYVDRDVKLMEDCLTQRKKMSDIAERSEVKTIFYGHFHNNNRQEIGGVYARCVDINEVFFFEAETEYHL